MRTLHKGHFIRNNQYGFEYMLPDGEHMVSVHNYTHGVSLYVIHHYTLKYRQELRLDKRKCPTWEDIVWGFEELAQKNYPHNIMKRGGR